jgi:YbgC/YbaW family acyl-CoA thioester hydrolase
VSRQRKRISVNWPGTDRHGFAIPCRLRSATQIDDSSQWNKAVFMTSSFATSRRVEFCETDMAGIVHFANFYRWMEQAEHEFFRSLGLSIVNRQPDGMTIGWPRVRAECRFHASARYEEIVEIELIVKRIGVKSLTWGATFRIGDQLVATGTMKTVCCVVRTGQPLESVAIPEEYLVKFNEHPECPTAEAND